MTVIAMTREMGSLGRDVALRVAEDLGLDLVQHEIVEHVAEKMHVRESSVNRFLEGKAGLLERWGINENELSLYTAEEILEVAARGNVLIRGWGATYVLREVPHVLCVRVCAPMRQRIDVVMERVGISDREIALKEIRRNDAAHARTMMHNFHVEYADPLLYDLTLNTAKLSVDDCVAAIETLVGREGFRESDASRAVLERLRVEAEIRAALRANEITARLTPSFEATYDPETHVVTLSGATYEQDFREAAERVVRELPEVRDVRNELIVLHTPNVGP